MQPGSPCVHARVETGIPIVALSGGVFQNRLLLEQLAARLHDQGFQVYFNCHVPPNDGGLSLGQAAIAAARFEQAHAPAGALETKEISTCV